MFDEYQLWAVNSSLQFISFLRANISYDIITTAGYNAFIGSKFEQDLAIYNKRTNSIVVCYLSPRTQQIRGVKETL